MVASLLTSPERTRSFAELLRPDLLVDGHEPEQRALYHGLSWGRYLALDELRGDDCAFPRFYYLDGILEIMSTSDEHEHLKTMLGGFMEIYFEESGVEIVPRGQATMWLPFKEAGAEPDESWCLGAEKTFPDIVLEIALTSGGVSKLELYRRFAVPEVWIWRQNRLEIFALREGGGDYEQMKEGSRLLPGI